MTTLQKILIFFVLPFIAPLIYPYDLIGPIWIAFILAAVLFGLLGTLLLRGNSTALTLSIFLQGINGIIRLMMFLPGAGSTGQVDVPWIIASVLSIALSTYLILRMDRTDVRVTMVT